MIFSIILSILACYLFVINETAPDFINKDIQYINTKCAIASTTTVKTSNIDDNHDKDPFEFDNVAIAMQNTHSDDSDAQKCQPYAKLNQFWIDFYDNLWSNKSIQESTARWITIYEKVREKIESIYKDIIDIKLEPPYGRKIKQIAVVGPYPVSTTNEQPVHELQIRNAITHLGFVPPLSDQDLDDIKLLPVLVIPKLQDTFFKADESDPNKQATTSTSSLDYHQRDSTFYKTEPVAKRLIATMLRMAMERYTLEVAQKMLETQPKLKNVIIFNTESLWDETLISPYIGTGNNIAGEDDTKSEKLAKWYHLELGKYFPQDKIFKTYDGIIYLKQAIQDDHEGDELSQVDSTCLYYEVSMKDYLHTSKPFEIQIKSNSESVKDKDAINNIVEAVETLVNLKLLSKPSDRQSSVSGSHSFRSGGSGRSSLERSARSNSMFGSLNRRSSLVSKSPNKRNSMVTINEENQQEEEEQAPVRPQFASFKRASIRRKSKDEQQRDEERDAILLEELGATDYAKKVPIKDQIQQSENSRGAVAGRLKQNVELLMERLKKPHAQEADPFGNNGKNPHVVPKSHGHLPHLPFGASEANLDTMDRVVSQSSPKIEIEQTHSTQSVRMSDKEQRQQLTRKQRIFHHGDQTILNSGGGTQLASSTTQRVEQAKPHYLSPDSFVNQRNQQLRTSGASTENNDIVGGKKPKQHKKVLFS